ncbi:MAG: hypothetical protein Q8T11_06875 [Elusimicrobiota bacterium]|nr:hypothetical protein [Elusimicrobiota bacterium]
MNALFALALLAASSWAGVVMPVESGVAPARPSAPVMPVAPPGGASLGAPSLGSAGDLRGSLPLLPSPVPGLVGPARHFLGETQAAAAASVRPEAGVVRPAPAAERALRTRPADKTPALPGKVSPGAPTLVFTRDRKSADSALDEGASFSREREGRPSSNPLVETSSLEHARPEKAAGLGRGFFDQSDESRRGTLEDPSVAGAPSSVVAATMLEGGAFGSGSRLRAPAAGSAFGAGHEPSSGRPSYSPDGETLHDAVASVPGGAAAGGAGGAVAFYRSASPNGDLARAGAAASPAAAALPVLGVPRPLAIDLSGSGLIVRVRSALGGALLSAPAAPQPVSRLAPGPSTAWIERGAMLEAFAVAGEYAARSAAEARLQAPGTPRPAVSAAVPASAPVTVPLWWAWFLLPLFVAAVRGIL